MNKHSFLSIVLVAAIAVIAASSLNAQQSPAPTAATARLLVTVESHHGSNPPVINREDVMVYEGKDRDKVTDWIPAQGESSPLELVILLDDGSNASLGTQLQDLRQFINNQPPSTKIAIAYMQNGIAKIAQNFTNDHAQASNALRLPMGIGGANASPYFSLSDLVKKWPQTNARREIFMATDGIDRYYGTGDMLDPYLDAAIQDAQRAGILVFSIYTPGVGHFGHSYWLSYWGQMYLAELSERTGAEAYYIGFTGPPVAFAPYLDDLEHRLMHQYWLTFVPKPQKKAGMQRVRLTSEVPNVDLVSAGEVYVPATP